MPLDLVQTLILHRAARARQNSEHLRHALETGQRAVDAGETRSVATALVLESRVLRHRSAELAREHRALLRTLAERSPEVLRERLSLSRDAASRR